MQQQPRAVPTIGRQPLAAYGQPQRMAVSSLAGVHAGTASGPRSTSGPAASGTGAKSPAHNRPTVVQQAMTPMSGTTRTSTNSAVSTSSSVPPGGSSPSSTQKSPTARLFANAPLQANQIRPLTAQPVLKGEGEMDHHSQGEPFVPAVRGRDTGVHGAPRIGHRSRDPCTKLGGKVAGASGASAANLGSQKTPPTPTHNQADTPPQVLNQSSARSNASQLRRPDSRPLVPTLHPNTSDKIGTVPAARVLVGSRTADKEAAKETSPEFLRVDTEYLTDVQGLYRLMCMGSQTLWRKTELKNVEGEPVVHEIRHDRPSGRWYISQVGRERVDLYTRQEDRASGEKWCDMVNGWTSLGGHSVSLKVNKADTTKMAPQLQTRHRPAASETEKVMDHKDCYNISTPLEFSVQWGTPLTKEIAIQAASYHLTGKIKAYSSRQQQSPTRQQEREDIKAAVECIMKKSQYDVITLVMALIYGERLQAKLEQPKLEESNARHPPSPYGEHWKTILIVLLHFAESCHPMEVDAALTGKTVVEIAVENRWAGFRPREGDYWRHEQSVAEALEWRFLLTWEDIQRFIEQNHQERISNNMSRNLCLVRGQRGNSGSPNRSPLNSAPSFFTSEAPPPVQGMPSTGMPSSAIGPRSRLDAAQDRQTRSGEMLPASMASSSGRGPPPAGQKLLSAAQSSGATACRATLAGHHGEVPHAVGGAAAARNQLNRSIIDPRGRHETDANSKLRVGSEPTTHCAAIAGLGSKARPPPSVQPPRLGAQTGMSFTPRPNALGVGVTKSSSAGATGRIQVRNGR